MRKAPFIVSDIRKFVHITILLTAGILPSWRQATAQHLCSRETKGTRLYENPLNERWLSAYDVKAYALDLGVTNESTFIEGSVIITAEATRAMDTLVLELQDALEVSGVGLPGSTGLGYTHLDDVLYISLDRTYEKGELFSVGITYGGEAGGNGGFFSGISSVKDRKYGYRVTYTLSEPQNARDWFPVKQVLEDKIDSVTAVYRCPGGLMVGSNGVLVSRDSINGENVFTWKTNYPMAYYLLSFSVADYRDFSFNAPLNAAGDSVLVQNFIYDSDELQVDAEADIRMDASLIHTFSRLVSEYPFADEKYGHCLAPMGGGMEHQTMTTLADFNFYLVAHELAHQWFGDHVTCGNWQDIWINEGFASYFEYIAAQEIHGQDYADNWMDHAMSVALRETSGSVYVPEKDAENAYRVFDNGLSYIKGATLLHMIRFMLDNDEVFFRVLRAFLEDYAEGVALGSDFREVLERESGMDFQAFFQQWYYGEGFPRFTLYWEQEGDSLVIRSEQRTTAPESTPLFQVPFEVELICAGGENRRVRLYQQEAEQRFYVPVDIRVEGVRFDPDNWLLEQSEVLQVYSQGTPFRYGPNPVSDELFIQIPNSDRIRNIRITSLSGQELLELGESDSPVTLDLSFLSDGPYLLELDDYREVYVQQIIKVSGHPLP